MLLASIGEVYIEIKLSSSCLNSHFFVFAVQKRELLKKYIYTSCPIKRVVKYPNTLFKEPPTQLFGALQTHSQNRVESNLCKKTFSRERTNFSLMNMENLNSIFQATGNSNPDGTTYLSGGFHICADKSQLEDGDEFYSIIQEKRTTGARANDGVLHVENIGELFIPIDNFLGYVKVYLFMS